jgi:pilus assembly protein CpaE
MNSASLRRIHVLVLRGDLVAAAPVAEASVPAEDLLRVESRIQTTVATAGFGQAMRIAQTFRPDVILLDGVLGDPVDLVSELDESLRDTPILVLLDEADPELVHKCVVAGARGCLARSVDSETLVATIVKVHAKASRRRKSDAERPPDGVRLGRLIAVRGAKGGVGTTLLAANLAIAIKRRANASTALVDGQFFGGDVPVMLNLAATRSIADLIPHLDRLDDDMLGSTTAEHASGIAVLAAPPEFEQAETIRADEYQRVLEALRARYAYVVVDCSPVLDQNSITAMDMADTLLLIATPEMPALKNAARLVQLGAQLGYAHGKLRLVVNRFNAPGALTASEFEHYLEYRTSFRIPNDGNVVRALTAGQPLVTLRGGSPAARAIDRLARTIVANEGWEGESRRAHRFLGLPIWPGGGRSQALQLQPAVEAA